ncbi:MAG TPA: peptidoglycan recognition family protein [Candidatus Limnocylindria bacterium]|nr:peptidoglycan recognition family protein [Candidatus Limnocylindria bacterium]
MTRSALAIPFVEAARARWPRAIPPDFDYGPDVEPGGPNDDSKLQENGRGLIQLRSDYPPPLELIGKQLYDDSLEKVVHHGIGHIVQKYLESKGIDVLQALYMFRGFRGTPEIAELEADAMDAAAPNSGWSFHPREQWAELFGAALSGRWIVNLGASQGERTFNDGKPIDALTARAWIDKFVGGGTIMTPTPFALQIIDVRDKLPLVLDAEVGRAAKSSITVHWNGPPIPSGEDPWLIILSDAWYHTSKDWSPEPGIQGGDGIMYHFLIAPDGRCFKTRDDDAVLWHCGSAIGNTFSYALQVMVGGEGDGTGDPVTADQYATLTQLIALLGLDDVKPHKIWSGTACPGLELTDWVNHQAWKEEDLTPEEHAWLKRVYDHLEAYEPLVWTSRLQKWLAKALKSFNPNTDLTGPDVESGQPFKS